MARPSVDPSDTAADPDGKDDPVVAAHAAEPNADGNPNSDRPGFVGRNSYEGPGYATTDLRVGREFALNRGARLDVSVDLFNLFNRTNVKDVNTVWGGIDINTPPAAQFGFGTPRDVFNPFQTQIGVKLSF